MKKFDLEKMKVKIAALLAKAERTDNADESEAYTEKAEALMVRLGIAKAELRPYGGGGRIPSRFVRRPREHKNRRKEGTGMNRNVESRVASPLRVSLECVGILIGCYVVTLLALI